MSIDISMKTGPKFENDKDEVMEGRTDRAMCRVKTCRIKTNPVDVYQSIGGLVGHTNVTYFHKC